MAEDKDSRDALAYVQNTLPNARRAAFETRLESDMNLREKVTRYRQTVAGLQHMAILEQLHKQQDREKQQDRGGGEPPPVIRPLWQTSQFIRAASVTLLLLVGMGVYRTYYSPARQAFTTYYRPDLGTRGSEETCQGLTTIFQLYQSEQYEQALEQINQLSGVATDCVRYQKGLLQLALGDSDDAIRTFEQMNPSNNIVLAQKKDWYLSLAYLKNNQPDTALLLLRKISTTNNHPFANSALRVLESLDR